MMVINLINLAAMSGLVHGAVLAKPLAVDMEARNVTVADNAEMANTICGQASWYEVGLGSCGVTNTDNDWVVALPANERTCGRKVKIYQPGTQIVHHATVVDTCPGCTGVRKIDLSPVVFKQFEPLNNGIFNMCWAYI
ncbi:hypothetical protein NA57DRAFT_80820 [Rhizodiscina lignyota]|uniref:RlpA-like protein double-psi beta-barrel domain-containing protein n=1 Tax=Rhizodiscina lignyota TaxID=1504668 RepID=A0A9P4I6G3_9PEZI|nr:hypothetical protein NA57DRAFT_80820 [Rhizodiscina lignyota]